MRPPLLADGAEMRTKPFHLAWFSRDRARRPGGEAWTGHIGQNWMEPEPVPEHGAHRSRRACFDYILLEDSSYVGRKASNGSTEIYLKNAIAVPRQDPSGDRGP